MKQKSNTILDFDKGYKISERDAGFNLMKTDMGILFNRFKYVYCLTDLISNGIVLCKIL